MRFRTHSIKLKKPVYSIFHTPHSKRNGQTIVEAVIALGVLTIGFSGIITLLNRSLSLNQLVTDQNIATYMATEGIEVTKNLVDAAVIQGLDPFTPPLFNVGSYELDFDDLLDTDPPVENPGRRIGGFGVKSNTPLFFDSTANLYSYDSGAPTGFYRTITINIQPGEYINVMATIDWTSKGGAQNSVVMEDYFFKWRP